MMNDSDLVMNDSDLAENQDVLKRLGVFVSDTQWYQIKQVQPAPLIEALIFNSLILPFLFCLKVNSKVKCDLERKKML